jgi:hypothetical protein
MIPLVIEEAYLAATQMPKKTQRQRILKTAHEPTHLGAVKIFELLTGIKYKK